MEPASFGKNGRFVKTDKNQVELPASRRDVSRDSLSENVFFDDDPLKGNVRILLLEFRREFFEFQHVRVIDRRDRNGGLSCRKSSGSKKERTEECLKRLVHWEDHLDCWLLVSAVVVFVRLRKSAQPGDRCIQISQGPIIKGGKQPVDHQQV